MGQRSKARGQGSTVGDLKDLEQETRVKVMIRIGRAVEGYGQRSEVRFQSSGVKGHDHRSDARVIGQKPGVIVKGQWLGGQRSEVSGQGSSVKGLGSEVRVVRAIRC